MGLRELIFGEPEVKKVPAVGLFVEETRNGIQKAYIPKFLYKPPYGYPRMTNLTYIRWLATSPYVEMCVDTIINEVASIDWDIVADDEDKEINDEQKKQIKDFLMNPNTNDESFEDVFVRMGIRDLLEVGNFVWVKVFNLAQDMVEIVSRDAATFTKNPDIHGMFTDREDILFQDTILMQGQPSNEFQQIVQVGVRERAAYFQYGWISGPIPVPFGRKEIVWGELKKRTDSHYVYSPIQTLANTLQALVWAIDSDVEFFNDNNMPPGVVGLDGADSDDIDAFREKWSAMQRKKDDFGNWKRAIHRIPIVNKVPKFERITLTAAEMELIEKQRWWSKLVFACFGLTPTNLGFTEDAQGQANQIVQSKVGRKRAINPILRLIEEKINKEVLPEFEFENLKFKFMVFDTDEERNKAELYKIQVESGLKTINQIREQEGDEPLEWGDEKPSSWKHAENSFSFGNYNQTQREAQETEEARKLPQSERPEEGNQEAERRTVTGSGKKPSKKDIETKPFAGYENFASCVRANQDKRDPEAYCAEIQRQVEGKAKKKAINTDSPLSLDENERPTSPERLEESILTVLRENEDAIKNILEAQIKPDVLTQIKDSLPETKGIDELIKMIEGTLNMDALRRISDAVIANNFIDGWEESQKSLMLTYQPDKEALKFIQDYTFDNIKDINETIADDLRQEISRGLMEGEGVKPLLMRVTKVFDVGENRAEMIARTETNRAANKGKWTAYKTADIDADKWLKITYDARTSEISKALGKKYGTPDKAIPLENLFSVVVNGKTIEGQTPPFHVNERDKLMIKPRPA